MDETKDLAETLYKYALAINETAVGPQHPIIEIIRKNYTSLLMERGKSAQGYKNGYDDHRLHFDRQSRFISRSITSTKAGRNQPCPCGSGKKYKKCHGA
jgi:uncharacterized protein YecA (UPF0149 family)